MRQRKDGRREARAEQIRIPPHAFEAEQAVLGGLMLDPGALDRVAGRLDESDFYRRDHQLIFQAIGALAERGRPFDAVTLGEWFESSGLAEHVAGGAYLIELAATTPSAANIVAYADIVREKSRQRALIDIGTQIVNAAFAPEGRSASDLYGEALGLLDGSGGPGATSTGLRAVALDDYINTSPDTIQYAVYPIIPRGVVTLWGGHGGAGKSVSVLQVAALGACSRDMEGLLPEQAMRSVYFSLEDAGSLARYRLRRISESYQLSPSSVESNVHVFDCPDGKATLMAEVSTFGVRKMVETPLLAQIRRQCEAADLVIIDNASDAYGGNENDRQSVRAFMTAMGRIARETNAGVVVLAHVDKAAARSGANGNTYSGSTAWHNSARSRVAIMKDDDGEGRVKLVHEKNNLGKLAPTVLLKWNEHGVLVPLTAMDRASARKMSDTEAAMLVLLEARKQGIDVLCATSGSKPGHKDVEHLPVYADHFGIKPRTQRHFHRAMVELEQAGSIARHMVLRPNRTRVEAWNIVESDARNAARNSAFNAPNDLGAPAIEPPYRAASMAGRRELDAPLRANGVQDDGGEGLP